MWDPLPLGFTQLIMVPAWLAVGAVPVVWGYAGWRPQRWAPFAYGSTLYGAVFVVGALWKGITFSTRNYGLNAVCGLLLLLGAIAIMGLVGLALAELGRVARRLRSRLLGPVPSA
jgi:tryptophan-rich sensory protein